MKVGDKYKPYDKNSSCSYIIITKVIGCLKRWGYKVINKIKY